MHEAPNHFAPMVLPQSAYSSSLTGWKVQKHKQKWKLPIERPVLAFAARAAVAAVFMDNTLTSVAPVSLLTACRMSNFN